MWAKSPNLFIHFLSWKVNFIALPTKEGTLHNVGAVVIYRRDLDKLLVTRRRICTCSSQIYAINLIHNILVSLWQSNNHRFL